MCIFSIWWVEIENLIHSVLFENYVVKKEIVTFASGGDM